MKNVVRLPKVSIVIPSYSSKTKPYLDLCMDAIKNLDYPSELIDVNLVTPSTYQTNYDNVKVIRHPNDNRSFAEAVNYGIKHSDQTSDFVFLLSDDTIPTKNSLVAMVEMAGDSEIILGPISNCDNTWLYNLLMPIEINKKRFLITKRFFTAEEIGEDVKYLKDSVSGYLPGLVFTQTLCMYATLLPRKVIAKVGDLDENFRDGYEDSDYLYRAKQLRIPSAVCLNAMIWHFGGRTTEELLTQDVTDKNRQYFESKWAAQNL